MHVTIARPLAIVGVLVASFLFAGHAGASWSSVTRAERGMLVGKVIVGIGELEWEPSADGGFADWLRFSAKEGNLTDFCLRKAETTAITGGAALLLVDDKRTYYLAVLESSLGNIRVDLNSVSPKPCPMARGGTR